MIAWARSNAGYKRHWEPFSYRGVDYPLDHLDDAMLSVDGSDGARWLLHVSFQDHCFTRTMAPSDDPLLLFSTSVKGDRCFCFDRYELSLTLLDHLKDAVNGAAWMAKDDNFMVVRIVDNTETARYYGIFFLIARSKNPDADICMWVQSAYAFEDKPPRDFGKVRFKHLLQRTMEGKAIKRIYGASHTWPEL